MKKLIIMFVAMLIAMPMAVSAKTPLEKEREKEYKTKMKEFKKGHWEIFGSARSLEVSLLTHYDKLDKKGEDGAQQVVGTTIQKSKNVLRDVALINACTYYSTLASSHIRGRIAKDMFGDANNTSDEFDKFYAAYEALVENEIKGEMRESFSVIREVGDNNFEIQIFYIVDEDAASAARIRAYENAMRESEAAQKYADQVSAFVREGFKLEK